MNTEQTIVFAKNITLHIGIDSEYANGRRARESGTRRHAPRFSRRARASLSLCLLFPPSISYSRISFLPVSLALPFSFRDFSRSFLLFVFSTFFFSLLSSMRTSLSLTRYYFVPSTLFFSRRQIVGHNVFLYLSLVSCGFLSQ